ncbi:MAG: hypothetical protein FRX49_06137 [Trebouxia sp. A1-2]|nr:MAG: hypothetical protein FRX49_06137 [Trebouxia sp. A1-2]
MDTPHSMLVGSQSIQRLSTADVNDMQRAITTATKTENSGGPAKQVIRPSKSASAYVDTDLQYLDAVQASFSSL